MSEASVKKVVKSINENCQKSGGVYADYSCKTVSWDDADRGMVGGALSCWGANITDTRLWEKNGTELFTVRSDNWNEKLGSVKSNDVNVIIGNHLSGGVDLNSVSLQEFLEKISEYGEYAGLNPDVNLADDALDQKVSIRFQTTFLPVAKEENASLEFATEAYNYNTMDDEDPRNLVVLCTTQGVAIQQDGAGAKKLYHHAIDDDGTVRRYWLEAERSKHKVGGAQEETVEQRAEAESRGKAVAKKIGIEAMGPRFNVLMTIQVPLAQKKPNDRVMAGGFGMGVPMMACCDFGGPKIMFRGACDNMEMEEESDEIGESNAARVSRGSEVDVWHGLSISDPKRDSKQHITVTVVFYNTVAGGVPKVEDVKAAIDDMESLYKACHWSGKLDDAKAEFMKNELTVKNMMDIGQKINEQPYKSTKK